MVIAEGTKDLFFSNDGPFADESRSFTFIQDDGEDCCDESQTHRHFVLASPGAPVWQFERLLFPLIPFKLLARLFSIAR